MKNSRKAGPTSTLLTEENQPQARFPKARAGVATTSTARTITFSLSSILFSEKRRRPGRRSMSPNPGLPVEEWLGGTGWVCGRGPDSVCCRRKDETKGEVDEESGSRIRTRVADRGGRPCGATVGRSKSGGRTRSEGLRSGDAYQRKRSKGR